MSKQGIDGDRGVMGQMFVGLLGWAQATFVSKTEVMAGKEEMKVAREAEGGLGEINVKLPVIVMTELRALLCFATECYEGEEQKIEKVTAIDIGAGFALQLEMVKVTELPKRIRGEKLENVDELITTLKVAVEV